MAKWQPGQSGNPAGKRPGTLGAAGKLRSAIAAKLPALIDRLTAQALDGDTAAAKLLLDRALPPLRPVDRPAKLPPAEGPTEIAATARAVLTALAQGSATPAEAGTLAGALAALTRVEAATELERRIAALEAQRTDTPPPNATPNLKAATEKNQ
jgi:hypothetical protein